MSAGFDNPILVEGFRGGSLEICHRGAVAVAQWGDSTWQERGLGDTDRPYFMRSASKFFQATPSVVGGIEERFGLDDRHLALMCASHGGEPRHVEVARSMLVAGGLSESDLHCGPHAPMYGPAAAALSLVEESSPGKIHNNCSGKHAGMMLGALALGHSPRGYADLDHPIQKAILDFTQRLSGVDASSIERKVDGCGAPTYLMPLKAAARAYASFATAAAAAAEGATESVPPQLSVAESVAAARLIAAVRREPAMIAGKDRFCTALVEATQGRVLVKLGADGFYGGMIPERRLGFALHIDDGQRNASERVVGELLRRWGLLGVAPALERFLSSRRLNCAGEPIGEFRSLDVPGIEIPRPSVGF